MTRLEIKQLWHELTNTTHPYGTEDDVINIINDFIPINLKQDNIGNYYTEIGDSKSLFIAHLDTVSKQKLKINKKTLYDEDGREYVTTDEFTILGADDKTGIVILVNMIDNNIPGTYFFPIGEEVGYVGSNLLESDFLSKFDRAISFDRRGYGSIINRQKGQWCCSDTFVKALSSQFKANGMKFKGDKTGAGTDAAIFMCIIPECTNLSVGYFNEHNYKEFQDIDYMLDLAETVLDIKWEELPTERIPESHSSPDPEETNELQLPEYKLYNIFQDAEDVIYSIIRSYAMNSESFKPNKEMRFAIIKDFKGIYNFSMYILKDGKIKLKKDNKEVIFNDVEDLDKKVEKQFIIKVLNFKFKKEEPVKEQRILNFNSFNEGIVKYPRGGTYLDDNKIQRSLRKVTQNIQNASKEFQFNKLYNKLGEDEILKKLGFQEDNESVELVDSLLNIHNTSMYHNFYIMGGSQYIALSYKGAGKYEWWHDNRNSIRWSSAFARLTPLVHDFQFLSEYDSLKELLYHFWREFGFRKEL